MSLIDSYFASVLRQYFICLLFKMLTSTWILLIIVGNVAFSLPIGNEKTKKSPGATASEILGKENDKYCPKTKVEETRALKKEQREDLFEGDVIPSEKLKKLIAKENRTAEEKLKQIEGRDVLTFESMHWKGKTIPYVFDTSLSDEAKSAALSAFQDFASYTCVRFIPRTSEPDYIRYFKGTGCYSYVGKNGGAQDLSIGSGCEYKGTVIHESMHAMGFFHEHTRLDRDKYVKIHWDNIKAGLEKNFQKYASGTADYLGQPYDFNSIMHYPDYAFAKDATKKTIEIIAIVNPKPTIGQRNGLSKIDIKQIQKLFKCDDIPTTASPATTTAPAVTTAPVVTTAPTTKSIPVQTTAQTTTRNPVTTTASVTTGVPVTTQPSVTTAGATLSTLIPITNKPTTNIPGTTPGGSSTSILLSTGLPTVSKPSTDAATKPAISVERPITITPQPLVVSHPNGQKILIQIKTGSSAGTYPQWPYDFSWNTNGAPQTCNCQSCNCQCVHMNEPSAGVEWKSNYLCYKKRGDIEPAIEWSYEGEIEGKRCTHISHPTFAKYWENNFLCVPKDSPYHFVWSFRGPVKANDMSCIRMGIPGGPKEWMNNYLCGKTMKKDDEDV